MLHKSPRLTVTTTSDVVLLNPAPVTENFEDVGTPLTEPTLLRGYVTITVTKARTIKGLSVQLVRAACILIMAPRAETITNRTGDRRLTPMAMLMDTVRLTLCLLVRHAMLKNFVWQA
jgi:hypothetical protein